MATYQKADGSVYDTLQAVLKQHHQRLIDVQVAIDCISAYASKNGPAVQYGGYPAMALVRVLGPKDRAMDRGDAEIIIDQVKWEAMSFTQMKALIDHELTHLVPTGKKDFLGRPKLKCRKHDLQFGWFLEVAERHGEASMEVFQAKEIADKHGQLLFGWPEKRRSKGRGDQTGVFPN